MKLSKLFLVVTIVTIAMTTTSCSKNDDSKGNTSNSCNDIVCGSTSNPSGDLILMRGTLNPDTCGDPAKDIKVNKVTYDYYINKMKANPKGYACWEGLK